ncbi:MAG: hypothetical protein CM15mP103_03750 [Gammaproteobacteria bacterium]|nr:MAG: hypothetical protein CM15mP103_03750 [Gammaproteobacteria bacterium]
MCLLLRSILWVMAARFRGIDQGDTRLDKDSLLSIHGQGYYSAIAAGVQSVMASFNSWNGDKIHGNRELLTDVLRGELGFDGFVVSDWNGIGQVSGCTPDNCAQAINAGIDMVMVPEDWRTLYDNMLAQVRSGEITEVRVDEAVTRILKVKFEFGLMERSLPSKRAAAFADAIGAEAHRELARDAVRRSLVLLKNDNKLLPLKPDGRYRLAGAGADDIGLQSGGWTISWQGTGNVNSDFPGGSSILDGFVRHARQLGGDIALYDPTEPGAKPDAVVMVMAENPTPKGRATSILWLGNRAIQRSGADSPTEGSRYTGGHRLLTGRPMWVNAEINASDAFVVAWLPGSEGSGVADVLLAAPTELPGMILWGVCRCRGPITISTLTTTISALLTTRFPLVWVSRGERLGMDCVE